MGSSSEFEEPGRKRTASIIETIDIVLDHDAGNTPRSPALQKFLEEERAKIRRWLLERSQRETDRPPEGSD